MGKSNKKEMKWKLKEVEARETFFQFIRNNFQEQQNNFL